MKERTERRKDLAIAVLGFLISSVSLTLLKQGIQIQEFILKFGCYAGFFTFLIYILRLRIAAEGKDPESNEAFKEYLKLGSVYCFLLFVSELPVMLASM
jgi:hypothetical protein